MRVAKWHTPMHLDEAARETIKGQPITDYLGELAAMRELTLAQFRHYDDDWLWQEFGWNDTVANNYWMWYYVYEDELNHRGEISWLKSRIPVTQ
ncbi:MAG: hypothetical protein R2867_07910 [Caldilineaceae bacterium]